MANIVALIGAIAVAVFALLFGRRKKKVTAAAPDNVAADVAKAQEVKQLQENLKRVEDALESDSPADSLADLGNARKR
jgi:LPXTG-motif cell wall-anchored protein